MLKHTCFFVVALALLAPMAQAQLPKRDLTVELRQIDESAAGGRSYRAGPSEGPALLTTQQIQVRNGEKGVMQTNLSVPIQWVSGAQDASANSSSGVRQSLQWFDAGQGMTVTPRWPGGKQPAIVEVEVQQSDMVTQHNADMPSQSRSQFHSTVTAPLDTWVTIAATGNAAQKGSYSSVPRDQGRRLLQIRVQLP